MGDEDDIVCKRRGNGRFYFIRFPIYSRDKETNPDGHMTAEFVVHQDTLEEMLEVFKTELLK